MLIEKTTCKHPNGCEVQRFDGFDEFLKFASTEGDNGSSSSKQSTSRSFHGGYGWEETLTLAKEGWADGVEKVDHARELLALPTVAEYGERIETHYAQEGDEVDVVRYLEGEPLHWMSYRPNLTRTRGRCVRVLANMSASCGFSHEVISRRGAMIAVLVDALESAGCRVEVWCGMASSRNIGKGESNIVETIIKLKAFEQRMEVDRMAFALIHPCMLRRLGFSAWEHVPKPLFRDLGSCMGYPANVRSESIAGEMDVERTVVFDSTNWNEFENDEKAVAKMREIIGEYIRMEE